ncbi:MULTISPECIES: sensor histidine kinase [Paenarthrobacter]|jgi:two-component system, NarL family, sensor histidine kinase DesK|uniref:sensor histidine kinase n=1 Tax=Paenarthrobacter TaxID=1742992 RepID=UPI002365803C|nr:MULTISPECIES: sensor histidine kinase [Paenarthrobacter]MDD7836600.1 sensor histidine kinase [Paenarthrobacter sp. AB444]MDP9934453.1 two-component system sensor histidine kinase DesK [Paenarthrobacter nicotinovorans]
MSSPSLWETLRGPGPRRWFLGAGLSIMLWAWPTWNLVWSVDEPTTWKVLASASLVAFFAAYAVLPMISRRRDARTGLVCVAILLALNGLVILLIGREALWTWPFLACAIGMTTLPPRVDFALIIGLSGISLASELAEGNPEQAFFQPALILSLGFMMSSFARMIRQTVALRAAQTELADAAVAAERSRVARDMHDILGHSLTVIAVKAELAGRLMEGVPAGPARDKTAVEIAEVQELARGALADVRATVAGYRGVNVLAELATARTALESAGIDADLPRTVEQVPAKHRELFGWVLREGVTNVVRHSGAGHCRVRLTASKVLVEDDGVGPGSGATGNGLAGIRERVASAGGTVSIGPSDLGGFRLAVEV